MKVVLVYRKQQATAHSIETLFHAVASELRREVDVIEYETSSRWRAPEDAARIRALGADVYHVTGDVNYFALLLPRKRTVLTVHDIGNYLYGLRGAKRLAYRVAWLDLPLRRAAAVTAVSEHTRQDIVTHLGLSAERVAVVPNCHGPLFRSAPKAFNAECPTILQVGTQPYKNVPRVVDALRGMPCRLVLIGPLHQDLRARLREARIIFESFVDLSVKEIHEQYLRCDLVTFVSMGEGFGVPILEAQATGRPLLTSDVSPLKDVAGPGACVVNPLDVGAIRRQLERLIYCSEYRDSVVAHGHANVVRYSPARVARDYLAVYRRVANLPEEPHSPAAAHS